MVMARLHVICGNCGSNDGFSCEYVKEALDVTPVGSRIAKFKPSIYLICENCDTIHDLQDNAKIVIRSER